MANEMPAARRIGYSAPARATRPGRPSDAAFAHFAADNVAGIPTKMAFQDKHVGKEDQIVPKSDEPGVMNVLNVTGAEGCAIGATPVAVAAQVNDQAAETPTGNYIPGVADKHQVVIGGVEEEKAVQPEIKNFVVQPIVDAATCELTEVATVEGTNPTAALQGVYKSEEHSAAETSDEAVAIDAAGNMTPAEAAGGAKAAPESSPTQGLAAVESVVKDTTSIADTVDSGTGNASAGAVSASESDESSTASTDDRNEEPASGDTTARTRTELSLIQKIFKKIFRKKGKRRRASKKKKATALKDETLAEEKNDGEESLGARARGEESFLVRIAREPEAEIETGAETKDGEDSSSCDERKPAAIERPPALRAVGASTAMIDQLDIMEFSTMDTE